MNAPNYKGRWWPVWSVLYEVDGMNYSGCWFCFHGTAPGHIHIPRPKVAA